MGKNSVGIPKHESEIVGTLSPFLQEIFKPKVGRDLYVQEEFSIDNGITDLSLFVVRLKLIRRRIHHKILRAFTRPSEAAIIAPLTQFPVLRKDTLLHYSGLLPQTFNNQLNNLVSAGAVRHLKKRGVFSLNPNIKIALEQSIAVEAKIEDWKTALYQATRYASFANKTFVALKADFIHRAVKYIDRFRANRVGLIEVDIYKNQCKIILSQTRNKPTSRLSSIIANERVFAHYLEIYGLTVPET